ncbi:MAG TPA: dipeptidase [Gemmatimonadales bacterium]|nr:dipeptidase [Gemmatimonadales bacterium]
MGVALILDGHIDTPQRMLDGNVDISARLPDGHVDIPRMRAGGIGAAFFSIWVDDTYGPGRAYNRALALIDAVRQLADSSPDVELATTAEQVRAAVSRGHVAALMGVEGGHAIENSLEKLDTLYDRGVRYMTLTWNNGNDWAGSSMDPDRGGGLSDFGKQVVRRMNALGMLVDVSHVSDMTFWDVLGATTRPVIASHSGCRALAAHPRNLTDEQLRAIAKNAGVVGIIFYPVFLDEQFHSQYDEVNRRLQPEFDAIRARYAGQPGLADFEVDKFRGEHIQNLANLDTIDIPDIGRLLDHIDHAVQVMGIDHVGLGSDFDGISVLPRPMKDATSLPLLVAGLESRGYGDSDVRKILGENFLRVLSAAR